MSRSRHTPASKGGSWIKPSTRWAIYHRDGFACVYCEHVGRLTIDHVESAKSIGHTVHENLVTACISCNSIKQALTMRQWLAKLRAKGIDTKRVQTRIRRALATPLNRAIGRFLAGPERSLDGLDLSVPGLIV